MLGIVRGCRDFLKSAQFVRVNSAAVDLKHNFPPKEAFPTPQDQWRRHDDYPQKFNDEAIEWIFVCDLLNFSFWSDEDAASASASAATTSTSSQGYIGFSGLVASLNAHRQLLCDPRQYANLSFAHFCSLFPPGLPLLSVRHQILTEAGQTLVDYFEGSFACFWRSCDGPADFIAKLCQFFPSFRDCPELWLLKRAQILLADLLTVASLSGIDDSAASTLQELTVFADYRIPQMLWFLGAIEPSPELAATLHRHQLLPSRCREELELRAAAVVAADEFRRRLGVSAVALDYYLLDWAQELKRRQSDFEDRFPFHRTRSVYY